MPIKIMTCDEVRPRLVARLDAEISAEERAAIEAHELGCADCRAVRRAYAAVISPVAIRPVETSDIEGAVLARIISQPSAQVSTDPLLEELRALRADMIAMRSEMTALRRQITAMRVESRAPSRPSSPRLFPFAAPSSADLASVS